MITVGWKESNLLCPWEESCRLGTKFLHWVCHVVDVCGTKVIHIETGAQWISNRSTSAHKNTSFPDSRRKAGVNFFPEKPCDPRNPRSFASKENWKANNESFNFRAILQVSKEFLEFIHRVSDANLWHLSLVCFVMSCTPGNNFFHSFISLDKCFWQSYS